MQTDDEKQRAEYYIRYHHPKYGRSLYEGAHPNLKEAAEAYVEDDDSVSAVWMRFDDKGILVEARDATEEVKAEVVRMIEEDTWSRCPHPDFEDEFQEWEIACEVAAEDQRRHERQETLAIHGL